MFFTIVNEMVRVLSLQNSDVRNLVPKWLRFLMLLIFSFLSWYIVTRLSAISPDHIDLLIYHLYQPLPLIVAFYTVLISTFAAWTSLVAATFASSIVPKVGRCD